MARAAADYPQGLLRAALDAGQVFFLCLREDGSILHANEALARELGRPRSALEGMHVRELGNRFEAALNEAMKDLDPGRKVRYETEFAGADGSALPVGIGVVVFDFEGESLRVLFGADLTEQRETRQRLRETQEMLFEAQKMEAIVRLAGGIAHDFNNLLAVVVGSIDLLESGAPSEPEQADLRREIREAAERGARLTRQLLAFSRQQMVAPSLQDPSRVVARLKPLLVRVLGESVHLQMDFGASTPCIRVDPAQVEQVLINLAVNARDAMPDGGELRVGVRTRDVVETLPGSRDPIPAGRFVELEVADTGTGMAPAIEARAFEPFFSTKERGKGTGLGLATVYGIVRQAGGFICLHTAPGAGTRFELLFPATTATAEELAAPIVSGSTRFGAGRRVLYVEDDNGLRRLTARLISDLGFDVVVAAHSHEALAHATRERSFDLLLTDVVLPGMNGLALAKRIAADHPTLRVLFVSGYAEDAEVLREIVGGRHSLLPKPFSREALSRSIEQTLGGAPFAGSTGAT